MKSLKSPESGTSNDKREGLGVLWSSGGNEYLEVFQMGGIATRSSVYTN